MVKYRFASLFVCVLALSLSIGNAQALDGAWRNIDETRHSSELLIFSGANDVVLLKGRITSHASFRNEGAVQLKQDSIFINFSGFTKLESSYSFVIDSTTIGKISSFELDSAFVYDENLEALKGVNFIHVASMTGGQSNSDGSYKFDPDNLNSDLVIQQVGRNSIKIFKSEFPVCKCRAILEVNLVADSSFKSDLKNYTKTLVIRDEKDNRYLEDIESGKKYYFISTN